MTEHNNRIDWPEVLGLPFLGKRVEITLEFARVIKTDKVRKRFLSFVKTALHFPYCELPKVFSPKHINKKNASENKALIQGI